MSNCPFCGRDPYHYVDNGVGMERVAVVCCELGIELLGGECRPEVTEVARRLYQLTETRDLMETLIEEARAKAQALDGAEE